MAVRFRGNPRTIQWAIKASGSALAFLDKKAMNDVVRLSMVLAGKDWGAVFLPKRFSDYVDRAPFPYPSHRLGFYYNKARRMGLIAQIVKRLVMTKGWDPWSTDKPSFQLIREWKEMNPGKYNLRDRVFSSGLIGDMRRNAKRAIMEVIDEMWGDGKFTPLVESGLLQKTVLTRVGYKATATANSQVLRITMPIPFRDGQKPGKGGINSTVTAVLGTVPHWEIDWFAKKLGGHIADVLNNRHGLSQNASGMVTARPRTESGARAFAAQTERASSSAKGR